MRYGQLEYLLKLIKEKYDDLNNDCGCYVGNKWLSIERIVNLIKRADEEY